MRLAQHALRACLEEDPAAPPGCPPARADAGRRCAAAWAGSAPPSRAGPRSSPAASSRARRRARRADARGTTLVHQPEACAPSGRATGLAARISRAPARFRIAAATAASPPAPGIRPRLHSAAELRLAIVGRDPVGGRQRSSSPPPEGRRGWRRPPASAAQVLEALASPADPPRRGPSPPWPSSSGRAFSTSPPYEELSRFEDAITIASPRSPRQLPEDLVESCWKESRACSRLAGTRTERGDARPGRFRRAARPF